MNEADLSVARAGVECRRKRGVQPFNLAVFERECRRLGGVGKFAACP